MEEEKKESEPIFKKFTREQGVQEYEKFEGKFEEAFAELEKIPQIDFRKIYLILPGGSKNKRLIIWGFSIAKQCNSKVQVVAKKTKSLEEEINKVSKAMNVEFEFVAGKIEDITSTIENEKSIVIMPKEIAKGIEREELDNPILIV